MRRLLFIFIGLAMLAAGAVFSDERHPRQPGWWPDPETRPFGLKWPPPKPENWPAGALWPPLRELGANPEFWARLYGEDPDAAKDPRFAQSGALGSERFRYNFDTISDFGQRRAPGCGLSIVARGELKTQPTCTPFPQKDVRAHCAKAFDQVGAEQQCRRYCARNPPQKHCGQGRLFQPPVRAYWRCEKFACFDHSGNEEACAEPTYQSDCFAFYLCDCFEL